MPLGQRFVVHVDGNHRDSNNVRGRGLICAPELRAHLLALAGAAFIDDGGSLGISFGYLEDDYGIPPRADIDEVPTIKARQYRVYLRGEVELGDCLFENGSTRARRSNGPTTRHASRRSRRRRRASRSSTHR